MNHSEFDTRPRGFPAVEVVCLIGSLLLALSCNDDSIMVTGGPGRSGLAGRVMNAAGRGLDSVRVYCLFTWPSPADSSTTSGFVASAAERDTFAFELFQNLPNPFAQSTFIRFSLPRDCRIRITISDPIDLSTKYTRTGTYLQGFYQVPLLRIVDSLQLRNGRYVYRLEATSVDGLRYAASREMFVLSTTNVPAATTDISGYYQFDYARLEVPDTVMTTTDGYYLTPVPLTSDVYLVFSKNGYQQQLVETTLFPNLVIQRDVVLSEVR